MSISGCAGNESRSQTLSESRLLDSSSDPSRFTMPVPGVSSKSFTIEVWCQQELSRLLKFPVEEELVSYLLSMETAKDIEEYLSELLGKDNSRGREFQREFFLHWHPPERFTPSHEDEELMQELHRPSQEEMVLFEKKERAGGRQKEKKDTSTVAVPPGFSAVHGAVFKEPPKHQNRPSQNPVVPRPHPLGRHKGKFVPLMSAEGKSKMTMHVPGRHPCQCLGQKHALVNNCMECGRIVCAQEGSGPCLFCGVLVCTVEEEELLVRDSKKAQKFREQLMRQYDLKEMRPLQLVGVSLNQAVQHRDKLLDFDQTSTRQTKVIDDEMDYFSVDSNQWMSDKEREALRKREDQLREQRHGSRRNKAITLDFAGRRVVEDDNDIEMYSEAQTEDLTTGSKASPGLYNPSISSDPPKYREPAGQRQRRGRGHRGKEEGDREPSNRPSIVRVQDRALQEMTDEGKCLSMHQPWASLLVTGIKRSEGRTWYTTHRGRLWIAAASKEVTPEELKTNEDVLRRFYGDKELSFPSAYPVSCLLGCVDVVDCLSQEEYREKYPEGESESPFVFICENPRELTVKFPLKGKHKIWKLPQDIHTSAKRAIKSP